LAFDWLRRQTTILSGIQKSSCDSKNQGKQLLSTSTREWTGMLPKPDSGQSHRKRKPKEEIKQARNQEQSGMKIEHRWRETSPHTETRHEKKNH
jgi:hypothetical protein